MPHVSEFRVRYGETDQMGVVYHPNYLVWCEIGRTDLIRALGASYADIERAGTFLAVVEARLRFMRAAHYDDMIRVTTRVTEVRSRAARFDYDIATEQGTRLATAYTVLAGMAADGRAISLPIDLRTALEREREAA